MADSVINWLVHRIAVTCAEARSVDNHQQSLSEIISSNGYVMYKVQYNACHAQLHQVAAEMQLERNMTDSCKKNCARLPLTIRSAMDISSPAVGSLQACRRILKYFYATICMHRCCTDGAL
jgi:hypothetical protein